MSWSPPSSATWPSSTLTWRASSRATTSSRWRRWPSRDRVRWRPGSRQSRPAPGPLVRPVVLEERLQRPKLPSHLPAYGPFEHPMKHPGEPLPRELAHLREAGPAAVGREGIPDVEDRGHILLQQRELPGRPALELLQRQLTRRPQRDRLVHDAPALLARQVH